MGLGWQAAGGSGLRHVLPLGPTYILIYRSSRFRLATQPWTKVTYTTQAMLVKHQIGHEKHAPLVLGVVAAPTSIGNCDAGASTAGHLIMRSPATILRRDSCYGSRNLVLSATLPHECIDWDQHIIDPYG